METFVADRRRRHGVHVARVAARTDATLTPRSSDGSAIRHASSCPAASESGVDICTCNALLRWALGTVRDGGLRQRSADFAASQ